MLSFGLRHFQVARHDTEHLLGVSADCERDVKKTLLAPLIPRMFVKLSSVQVWGHQKTLPGGFHSSCGLNAIVTVQ